MEGVNEKYFISYTKHRRGRMRFYQFDAFFQFGIQFYPYASISELSKSWRITKKLLKTRSRPKATYGMQEGKEGVFVFRTPRIYGEEFLTKILNATRFTSGEQTFL